MFGFLGPNGAGKSTTIKCLMRLIFPTRGTARILGKSIEDISMHQNIGYLPEQPYFYDYLTATEVLDYFARFHGMTANDRKEHVERTLKKVGLERAKKIQLRKYSKGMLQRVGLAQAIYMTRNWWYSTSRCLGWTRWAQGSTRHYSGIKARGTNRAVLDAHSVGRRNVVRPRWRHCRRKAAGCRSPRRIGRDQVAGDRGPVRAGSGREKPALLKRSTQTGERYRIQLKEEELYAALDELKLAGSRILSVTQIKATLEEFFMGLVEADRAQASAVEVHGK